MVDGQNFLVPVDARLARAGAVELEAIPLATVTAVLSGALKLRLVILDACRSNPFRARLAADATGGRKRSVGRGLVRIEPGENELIAFAAAAGTEADDGAGRHSPFTAALLKQIETPGLEIRLLFGGVRDDVLAATRRRQTPHVYGTLGRQPIYLKAPPADAKAPVVPPLQPSAAALEWARVDKSSVAELQTFERRHPASAEAEYARARLKGLKKVAVVTPAPPPPKVVEPAIAVAPEADLRPGRTFRDCPDCPEMVVVPAGGFTMGSPASEQHRSADEGPQHRVTIARPFAVGKFEVTRGEFETFVRESGRAVSHKCWTYEGGKTAERTSRSFRNPRFVQDGRHPAVCVNWSDTSAFVDWLSRKTGKNYRLLTETEWEYAARGVTSAAAPSKAYWWGENASHEHANYGTDQCCFGLKQGRDHWVNTAPVGQFPANPFGLRDMHGNVWEWVEDCWNDNYNGAPSDGSAWTTGDCSDRVLRGGSWYDYPQNLRSANRDRDRPGKHDYVIGFRVSRTF